LPYDNPPHEEGTVPLIQVKVIEGVSTAPQKQEIIERLTDAMVAIEGESLTANERALARRHGLALRDPARPELGWRLTRTSAFPTFTGQPTTKEQA
jgi:hypothetical protein